MADFLKVMEKTFQAEHNSIRNYLHKNKKEKTYTFMGVYPYTKLKSYKRIDYALKMTNTTQDASEYLSHDKDLYQEVLGFYYLNFYKPMGLDFVKSTHKATEIMVFIINVGIGRKKRAVKAIQRIVGAKVDGILGVETLTKLNDFDDAKFSRLWDSYEISFYEWLVEKYPRLSWALKGWGNRARLV